MKQALLALGVLFALFLAARGDVNLSAGLNPVTQSGTWNVGQTGTWTVQPGNTPNTSAWLMQLAQSSSATVATASVTSVKATAGTLRRVIVGTEVASGTIQFYDATSANCTGTPANPRALLTLPATVANPVSVEFNQTFANGICVKDSSATINLTVIYD